MDSEDTVIYSEGTCFPFTTSDEKEDKMVKYDYRSMPLEFFGPDPEYDSDNAFENDDRNAPFYNANFDNKFKPQEPIWRPFTSSENYFNPIIWNENCRQVTNNRYCISKKLLINCKGSKISVQTINNINLLKEMIKNVLLNIESIKILELTPYTSNNDIRLIIEINDDKFNNLINSKKNIIEMHFNLFQYLYDININKYQNKKYNLYGEPGLPPPILITNEEIFGNLSNIGYFNDCYFVITILLVKKVNRELFDYFIDIFKVNIRKK